MSSARGQAGFHNIAAALRNRNFAIFVFAHAPGLVGMWAQRIGIGWLAWELTESPGWLGAVAMADLLPSMLLAPFSGAIADRVNIVRMLIVTQIVMVAHATALWLLTAMGLMDIWLLFGLAFLLGINNPFSNSARHNLFPMLVPPKDLAAALAFNSMNFNLARFLGPALAGTVIALSGVVSVFAIEAVAECILLIATRFLTVQPHARKAREGGIGAVTHDVRDGMVYAARHPGIGPMLLLLMCSAVTSRPSIEMLPGFADEVFARGAQGLGWLGAAVGAGGIVGSLWLARRGAITGMTSIVILHTLLMTLSLFVFALGSFWISLAFLALTGFFMVANGVGTQTLLQWAVDPAMRGRVMSLYTLLFRGMPALGALLIGIAAEHFGLRATVAGASLLCIGVWFWAFRNRKRIAANLELPPPDQRHAGPESPAASTFPPRT